MIGTREIKKEPGGAGAQYRGTGIGKGFAVGRLYFLPDAHTGQWQTAHGTPEEELVLYRQALARAKESNEQTRRRAADTLGEEEAAIFEIYGMLLEDADFNERIEEGIAGGERAADAVRKTAAYFAARFRQMDDPYLSARAADLTGLGDLVAEQMERKEARPEQIPAGSILVAPDLTPNQTVTLDKTRIAGFVTFFGAPTSHTAILARAMGLPALVQTGQIPSALHGREALIDAEKGALYPEPDQALLSGYRERESTAREEQGRLHALRGKPSVSLGGRQVHLYANIGSTEEVGAALHNDAEGIGLFRSEFLYLGRETPPGEEEEFHAYKSVISAMHFKRVIIRTLDIGADKQPSYMQISAEENPALGLRGIRVSLARPALFRRQLRAILRASAYGRAALMFPMITLESELLEAREHLRHAMEELERGGIPYDRNPEVGIMLETPAAALLADRLAPLCDFFSVGSNDLFQYTYAADRQNATLGAIGNAYPEAMFRLIASAAQCIHKYHGKWIGVCGEAAADPGLTQKFLDCGVDELSVSPPYVLRLRQEIRNCR